MKIALANHNNTSGGAKQKEARRQSIIDCAMNANIVPNNVMLFPGMMGSDAKLIHAQWPEANIVGLERFGVAYHQRDRTIFDEPNVEMLMLTLRGFLKGSTPRIEVEYDRPDGSRYSRVEAVSAARKAELDNMKFNLAYLDYVKPADKPTVEELEDFLTNRVDERFVVAVANSKPKGGRADLFHEYEPIAAKVGAKFFRDDYKDTAHMNFAILMAR